MPDFIPAGTRHVCPVCKRTQLFERSVPATALPVTIRCSFKDCRYTIAYSVPDADRPPVFPKLDIHLRVQGNWVVEMQAGEVKDYWKPIGQQVSFPERCRMIASHVAGAMQTVQSLRVDLEHFSEQFTEQFSAEWSMATSFLRYWNPGKIEGFVKHPFCSLPVKCQDRFITARTRLFLHPDFYAPSVGYPLTSFGGYCAQMVTPYTLINFPLETHLQNFMQIMPAAEINVVGDRVVGKDLFRCWRDIPGTIPDREHHDDAPLLQIKDSLSARTWLARLGISPWNVGELTTDHAFPSLWSYYKLSALEGVKPHQVAAFKAFAEHGRLALFYEKPLEAWEIAMTIGSFLHGQKLVLTSSLEHKNTYQSISRHARENSATLPFQWKEVRQTEDIDEHTLQGVEYVILNYADDFPPEALEKLYDYPGRLVIIGQDMLMDTLTENWEASLLFGLVAKSIWYPELPATNALFNYDAPSCQESLVGTILRNWFEESKIKKAKS